jgi:probable phosphoglycerate mutase
MNDPIGPGELNNRYFAVRHGTSLANEEGIIVSEPEHGVGAYGLSEKGKEEVRLSAVDAKRTGLLGMRPLVIVSSDFDRTKETAEIVASVFDVPHVAHATELRERFFGDWEKTSNGNYQRVWDEDAKDHLHKKDRVQSVAEVVDEVLPLIRKLEKQYADTDILLVSHGDRLQILQTVFDKVHPSAHRSLAHLKTAEIRPLN